MSSPSSKLTMKQASRIVTVAGWLFVLTLISAWLYFGSDAYVRQLLRTTITLSLQVTAITIPLGALLSILLCRTDLPGGKIWPFLCAGLLILPTYVLISGWDAVVGPIGWAKTFLPQTVSIVAFRWWSAVLLHSLLALPGVVLILSLALSKPESELEDIGLMHWPWPIVLLRVSLRRAAPLLLVCALWIFVTVSGEIAVTDIYQIRTMAEEIYLSIGASSTGTGEFPYQGIIPFLVLSAAAALLALSIAENSLRAQSLVSHVTSRPYSLRAAKWPLFLVVCLIGLPLLLVPLGSLIYKAGLHVEYPDGDRPFQTWSVQHTVGTLQLAPTQFADVLYWTAIHAALSGSVALALAIGFAWAERCRPSLRIVFSLLVICTIAIPGPLVGLGLLRLLSNGGEFGIFLRDRTLFAPVAAAAIRSLPWIVLLLRHAFRTIPQEHLELAKLHGWGGVRSFFSIALPQRWALVMAGLLFAIGLCLSEVATSLVVTPPGVELASVRMMGMLHSGVENQLAGLALLLGAAYALALIPLFILLRLSKNS